MRLGTETQPGATRATTRIPMSNGLAGMITISLLCRTRSDIVASMRFLVFVLLSLATQSLTAATPESVGMSSERLDRIDRWLEAMVSKKQAAGFVTLVARRGQIVHHKAHGSRGLSVTDPMPVDALFDIASMTKPVTAIAALMELQNALSRALDEESASRVGCEADSGMAR